MRKYSFLFPDGKTKALTFSYDDGVIADQRLIGIMRENGLKGTFNLNGNTLTNGQISCWPGYPDVKVRHVQEDEVRGIYDGMEIAGHGLQHCNLEELNDAEITDEIHRDRMILERLAGYPVKGFAYAGGRHNERVISRLRGMGVAYARTVVSTHNFRLPSDFLAWHPTVHHDDGEIQPLIEKFLALPDDTGFSLFYIWGHTYEFVAKNNWEHMERICERLGHHENIWYASNLEVYDYVQALLNLRTSADGSMIRNMSCTEVWLLCSATKEKIRIPAGAQITM